MQITHTKEVLGVEQDLVRQIAATVKEAYLTDIRNSMTKFINETVVNVLTHLQDNYGQLMPHKLIKREDIVKKTTYHP